MEVILTLEAKETFKRIVYFIRANWGGKSAEKFKLKALKTLQTISTQHFIFKASTIDTAVRQGFITRQTSVIYEVRNDHILVLYFWDKRQDPIVTDSD